MVDDTEYDDARGLTLTLMATRAPGKTVCPSEVASALAAADPGRQRWIDWRDAMSVVHATVDELSSEGLVEPTWKGKRLPERRGPYRIGRVTNG
jgi:hypothetical protein